MNILKLFAYWVICMLFCCLLIFFPNHFFETFVQEYITVLNSLDLYQARHYIGPDLGPNGLQSLSADGTSRPRVKSIQVANCLVFAMGL